ncbi:MAG TPA: S8 family serine peptidase, partial [Pyrinomonadaceae bacterium]
MHRRNYTLHVMLAAALVVLAAAAGRIERWDWKRDEAPARVVVRAPVAPAVPEVAEELSEVAEESDAEVLVRFKPGVTVERVVAITARLNDRVEDEIESVEGLTSIDDLDDAEAEAVAAEYAALPEVEYAEPNTEISVDPLDSHSIRDRFVSQLPLKSPNDPLFAEQWGLVNTGQRGGRAESDVSALAAWQKTQGSKKVVVAVLDSGVDYTHPDLAGNMWHRPADLEMYFDEHLGVVDDFDGFSALAEERDPMDENGHGTHCSGIVGAEGDNKLGITGVNWRVEIMPLKFMGRGGFGSTKDAIEAINYVIARKKDGVNVRVISASWGSTARSKALEDVIRKAGEADILFVAAAG